MTPRSLAPLVLAACLACAWPAAAQQPADKPLAKEPAPSEKEIDQRIAETLAAVVRVKMRAVPEARSREQPEPPFHARPDPRWRWRRSTS